MSTIEDARLSFKIRVMSEFAVALGTLSTCKRAGVGAICVPFDLSGVLSLGYNGQPAGMPNDGCTDVTGECGCVHGEANAVIKLSDTRPCAIVCTTMPCRKCAELIVNKRTIRLVLWRDPYRNEDGIKLFDSAGIMQSQTDHPGAVAMWKLQGIWSNR